NRVVSERDVDGILRLTIRHVREEDAGSYTLKVWNDYGQAASMGKLVCECISKKARRPVGDEYQGWDKMKRTGIPVPLPDRPFISALSDRRVTVSWNPYIAQGPQPPVTYQVEMCESPEGDWFTARSGIRGTAVDITNLAPKSDYKFRVRVENNHGVSEPSPYVATFRVTDKDAGVYECHARNEHGESRQRITFEIAEYPG
ncbi:obscurin-like, partial [Hyalella azteca]|uniref:Obscurin-like n=1 Tax=Hyalella azteca TaxID=294128 RepID=A0A8B7PDU1_HYAAZ